MGPEQPHRRRLAMTDPIFERLPSETLDEAAKALEWKPCIEGGAAYRSLGELPTSARIEWLDKNRERLEDAIRSAGSWTLGETRTYPAVIRGLAEKLDVKVASAAGTREIESALVAHLWHRTEEKLSPADKQELHRKVEEEARKHGKTIVGELGIAGVLGAAQLSGFGVYMLGSTLLGGLGLGFGVFTALSSFISFAIGPPGWILLGLGTLINLTGPNYKKILPVAILVATGRAELVEKEIEATRLKLQVCRDSTHATMARIMGGVNQMLDASTMRQIAGGRLRLARLRLTDHGHAAVCLLQLDDTRARHETEVSHAVRSALATLGAFSCGLQALEFPLPTLSTSGNRSHSVAIRPSSSLPPSSVESKVLLVQIRLKGMRIKHIQLFLRERICGFFSESTGTSARNEQQRLVQERIEDAARQFQLAWDLYHHTVVAECHRIVTSAINEVLDGINAAEVRLQEIENAPSPRSGNR